MHEAAEPQQNPFSQRVSQVHYQHDGTILKELHGSKRVVFLLQLRWLVTGPSPSIEFLYQKLAIAVRIGISSVKLPNTLMLPPDAAVAAQTPGR